MVMPPLLITSVLLAVGDSYCHACWDTESSPSIKDLIVVHAGKGTTADFSLLSLIKERCENKIAICKMLLTYIF